MDFSASKIVLSNSVSITPKMPAEWLVARSYFDDIIRTESTGVSRYAMVVDKIVKFIERVDREGSYGIY